MSTSYITAHVTSLSDFLAMAAVAGWGKAPAGTPENGFQLRKGNTTVWVTRIRGRVKMEHYGCSDISDLLALNDFVDEH